MVCTHLRLPVDVECVVGELLLYIIWERNVLQSAQCTHTGRHTHTHTHAHVTHHVLTMYLGFQYK